MHIPRMQTKRKIDLERGQRIRYVRRDLLSMKAQETFAAELSKFTGRDYTRGAVGNWELGKEISLESLRAIAQMANVSLDWLAYNNGPQPAQGEPPRVQKEDEIRDLLRTIDGLNDQDIAIVLGIIKRAIQANSIGLEHTQPHGQSEPTIRPHEERS